MQMSVTSQRPHENWGKPFARCSDILFFLRYYEIHSWRKAASKNNSSGDITAEGKAVNSSSVGPWLFGHSISNSSYMTLRLSPVHLMSTVLWLCDTLLRVTVSRPHTKSLFFSYSHTQTHTLSISLFLLLNLPQGNQSVCIFKSATNPY